MTVPTSPVADARGYGFAFDVAGPGDGTPWYRVRANLPDAAYVREAENFRSLSGDSALNRVESDSAASAGRYVRLSGAGDLTIPIANKLYADRYFIEIRARASDYRGPVKLHLSLGGIALEPIWISQGLSGAWRYHAPVDNPVSLPEGKNRTLVISLRAEPGGADGSGRTVDIDQVRLFPWATQAHAP
jgi:hypothetical protein